MSELNIPVLEIEEFDPDVVEDTDEIKDESGGAIAYGIIGSGQGGGRIAKAFFDLGYRKTVAFNTAQSDLALLELPDNHKFLVERDGGQGAGKNQETARAAYENKSQEVFNKLRELFGSNVDRILVCVGVAGGTGGGSVNTLIELAKKYFSYIGHDDIDNRVGVIASLPTTGEVASPRVAENAYMRICDLWEGAARGEFAPLIIVDNDKIKKLYPQLTVKQFWPTINNTVAGLFHIFNLLATKNSNYTSFDPTDYDSIMKTKGCMIMGVTAVKEINSETALANALKNNLEKTLLAGGFDLTTATAAASVVVGGTNLYEEVHGLMDSIEYAFDTLATLTGGAMIHRGIYEDSNKTNLVVYTIVGGLDAPRKRIEELKKFLRTK